MVLLKEAGGDELLRREPRVERGRYQVNVMLLGVRAKPEAWGFERVADTELRERLLIDSG